MKHKNPITSRLYKTKLFKGLVNDYTKQPEVVRSKKAVESKKIKEVEARVRAEEQKKARKELQAKSQEIAVQVEKQVLDTKVPMLIQEELTKAKALEKKEAMQFRYPGEYNNWTNPDKKPGSDIPFSYMRRMAVIYPIARACINRRIRQVTQLQWDITTIDEIEDEKGFKPQTKVVKDWLKSPLGHKTRFREMLTIMVDDILTVDGISFEKRRTVGGDFLNLVPVDPTTIALRVTDTGGTPEPPDTAYAQFIGGKKIAEFSTDEMIYESMTNRSYSPYGLAPLESLILQAEAALRGTMYNLSYFKENNIPEGFLMLPEDIASNPETVQQWQLWFDAITAGDQRMMHRLKILPGGSEYTAAKKPEDMAFERFELWLLQQTCAVFDVPPQEIGITYQVNKATGETQADISREKGLIPLANLVKEVLDMVIQEDLGFESLQFMWIDLNPTDRKAEIEIAEKEINMGAKSVDEYRIDQGLEPIGLGHYIKTGGGVQLVDDLLNGVITGQPQDDGNSANDPEEMEENPTKDEEERKELRRWRKCVYRDLESGRNLRKFSSDLISRKTRQIIQTGLNTVKSRNQAKMLFDQFLDPRAIASTKLLKMAEQMRKIEDAQPN